jgi:hypothetical protein
MAISGLPPPFPASEEVPALPRSPAVANLRLLDELSQILEREPIQLLCDLANRFHRMGVTPDQVQQIAQMLTLPDGIALPTHNNVHGIQVAYQTVSPARLLQILSHVTMFDCGVQQLLDLAELCNRNDLHLCFLESNEYAFDTSNSLDNHNEKMLYIELPVNADELCSTMIRNVATMPGGVLHLEQAKLIELLRSLEKVDGYLIGHELSHATALAKCYPTISESNDNRAVETFFNAICQQLTDEAIALLCAHTQTLTLLLRETLFQTGEEARNVLGLGMGENFARGNDFIVSEFDFLQEVQSASLCMPMPYVSLERIRTDYPKVCMAFLTLIFKLKEQSIADSGVKIGLEDHAMQSLKATLEETKLAEQNRETIQQQLNSAGYEIQPVRGDGDCGFYAILQALNPTEDYRYFIQGESVEHRQHLPQWEAAKRPRKDIANMMGNPNLAQMVTTPLGTEDQQMGFNALPAVARHLNRPLVVINTTPDADHHMFAYYDQNGTQYGTNNFQTAMNRVRKMDTVILLYRPGHWEAAVPQNLQNALDLPDDLAPVPLEKPHHRRCLCNPCSVA